MRQQPRIALWCERIIEGGWLLALVLIPSYFNLLSSRHFEPDKATTLRAIVLVMIAAAIVRWLDSFGSTTSPPATQSSQSKPSFWHRFTSFPMAVPVALYVLVFLFATVISVTPHSSFWGSYQRLQGTYTNLSYVGLGVLVAAFLRRREQLERLVMVLVLGSLPAACYGLIQHFQLDPLPWRGDVVARVASTMGNSIFVAAYMILVLPFALYRAIAAFHESKSAPSEGENSSLDLGWGIAYLLLVIGALLLIFASMEFGAVVRTADLRYWWIYPGALIVAFVLFLVPTLRPHSADRLGGGVAVPGIVALLYVLCTGIFFALGQASGEQVVSPSPGRGGTEWPLWMVLGTVLVAVGYGLIFTLMRRSGPSSRLFLRMQGSTMLLLTVLLLVAIFFTQSRGPWIGGAAGLFTFFTLLLIQARSRARANGSARAALWRNLLIAEVMGALVVGGFLVAFNLSDAPVFQELRKVPYIGRMGRLLEVDSGTGLVRRLIWIGDDKAGGAVALITSDPVRAVVGWGPESMFVAYNRFYPPSLANIEARGASPDRSHQAYLDELINKGLLGLISYLFVLISFFALAWRLIRRTSEWQIQVLLIGCIAVVTAHAVEGLTGIPIVSTLMLLWVTIAVTVATGAMLGEYTATAPEAAIEPQPEPAPEPIRPQTSTRSGRKRQAAVARGSGGNRAPSRRSARSTNPMGWLLYTVVTVLALLGVWSFNVDNVYADMRFQQGQTYTEDPSADLERYIIGTSYYLDAIRMEPEQDFYYLNLGRSLMSIVDIRRQDPSINLGQPIQDAELADLLRLQDPLAVQEFVIQQPPLALMSYAEAVLNDARELSPLNKDHYANLARMYNFWFSRLTRDPALLQQAIDWYRQGHEIAPQDVTILNEYAGAVALYGASARAQGDEATAQQQFALSDQLLAESKQIDPRYADTDIRIAETLRVQERYPEAVERYVALIEKNPRSLDSQINTILESLQGQKELLLQLRDAYQRALDQKPDDVATSALIGLISARAGDLPRAAQAFADVISLQPQNLEARQNYTLVLSDMLQYQQAANEAQTLLELAQQQQLSEQDRGALEALLNFLRNQAAQGN